MGNTVPEQKDSNPTKQFDSWREQNQELQEFKTKSENKCFKTYQFSLKSQNQSIIVKICLKDKFEKLRGEIFDSYQKQIQQLRQDKFPPNEYPGIMPYLKTIFLDQNSSQQQFDFVAVVRQATQSNLSDRFLEAPYLQLNEKNWILFQVIASLYAVHQKNMYHGNIRSSNILLTSSNHAYLTDFGLFKPIYIKQDQKSDYDIHFMKDHNILDDRCYLAPEKFKNQETSYNFLNLDDIPTDTIIALQQMDIFALGCVIMETYDQNAKALFTYKQIFQYQKDQYDPDVYINKIANPDLQQLIRGMTNKDPSKRMNITDIFQFFCEKIICKKTFTYLYYLDATLTSPLLSQPDIRLGLIQSILPSLYKNILKIESPEFKYNLPLNVQALDLINYMDKDQILKTIKLDLYQILDIDFQTIAYKNEAEDQQDDSSEGNEELQKSKIKPKQEDKNVKLQEQQEEESEDQEELYKTKVGNIQNLQDKDFKQSYLDFTQYQQSQEKNEDNQKSNLKDSGEKTKPNKINYDLKIIIKIICSNIRSARYQASKLVGIEMLDKLSHHIPENESLHLIIPYICKFFKDGEQEEVVICAAYQCFVNIVKRMKQPFLSLGDTVLLKEVIFDQFNQVSEFENQSIRRCFAENISNIIGSFQTLLKHVRIIKYSEKARKEQERKLNFIQQENNDSVNESNNKNQNNDNQQQSQGDDDIQFYDNMLQCFRNFFRRQTDFNSPNASIESVKITISQVGKTCAYFRDILEDIIEDQENNQTDQTKKNQIFQNIEKMKAFLQEILSYIMVCLNNQELIATCAQYFPEIVYALTNDCKNCDISKNPNMVYIQGINQILEGYLYSPNIIQLKETLIFFIKLTTENFFTQEKELELLQKIAPIMLYPHNWIRNLALQFIYNLLEKYESNEIYIYGFIQPLIAPYIDKEIKFINKQILQISIPAMLPRELFYYKSLTIYDNKTHKDNIQLFKINYWNFLKSFKTPPMHTQQNELEKFKQKLSEINQKVSNEKDQQYSINLTSKSNDFLKQIFKYNIETYDIKKQFKFQIQNEGSSNKNQKSKEIFMLLQYLDLYSKYLISIKEQMPFSELEAIQKDYFKKYKLEIESRKNITIQRQRYLKNLNKQIIEKQQLMLKNIQSNFYFKNMLNHKLQLNHYLMKFEQFFVIEELEVGKPIRVGNNPASGQVKNWQPQGQLVSTIYENQDVVSCLEVMKGDRFFISGSYDGYVRIYDIDRIEKDQTADSIAEIKCQEYGDMHYQTQKIKTVKTIEDSCSLLYGTDKGIIDLIRVDYMHDYMNDKISNKNENQKRVQRYRMDGEIKAIETFKNDFSDKCFMYCTSKGNIGIKDIRQKSTAVVYNIGPERGLISCLLLRPNSCAFSAAIGTLNGYCLTYDIRCNMVSNFSQLQNSDNQPLPIISMDNFYQYINVDTLVDQNNLVAIGYASDHNEIGFFNLDSTQDQKAQIYMLSTKNQNEDYKIPQLKVVNERESTYTLKDMFNYDFIPDFTKQVDVLQYQNDPLISNQNKVQSQWLNLSKNCYTNISNIYKSENIPNKIICYPQFPLVTGMNVPKQVENYILTTGNDRNIRFQPMLSDPVKEDPKHQSFVKGFHVCNVENKDKAFKQVKSGGVNVLHEFDRSTLQYPLQDHKKEDIPPSFNKMDKRAFHMDSILDMALVQRQNAQLLITASRDRTIKIWK